MKNLIIEPQSNKFDVSWEIENPSGEIEQTKVMFQEIGSIGNTYCYVYPPFPSTKFSTECESVLETFPLIPCTNYYIEVQPRDYGNQDIGVKANRTAYTKPGTKEMTNDSLKH